METVEDINTMLDAVGITLTFPTYTIKGIPGFEFTILYREASTIYEVKKQDFLFQVAAYAVSDNNIDIGNTFTITDTAYTYSFKVIQNPLPDLTGWMQLDVEYKGKVAI